MGIQAKPADWTDIFRTHGGDVPAVQTLEVCRCRRRISTETEKPGQSETGTDLFSGFTRTAGAAMFDTSADDLVDLLDKSGVASQLAPLYGMSH